MKKTIALSLGLIWTTLAQSQTLIIDAPLQKEGQTVGIYTENMLFKDGAVYSGGEYETHVLMALVEEIDLAEFTISVQFKAEIAERMPVFVLGEACRLIAFVLEKDGRVALSMNNGSKRVPSELRYQPNTWHTATLLRDRDKTTMYLDGQLAATIALDFETECAEEYGAYDVSITDYGNGDTFRGWLKNLKIYNGLVPPSKNPNPNPQPLPNPNPKPLPNPNPQPNPHSGSLKDKTSVTEVDLGAYRCGDVSRFGGTVQYAGYADGSAHFLAWNAQKEVGEELVGDGAHITPLDANMKRSGADIILKNYTIEDILAVEKGYLSVLLSEVKNNGFLATYPNQLSIAKIDLTGKILFKTILAGDKGTGAQQHWMDYNPGETQFLFNGTHYGVWFEVKKNWAEAGQEDDVHNGDKFMAVDKNGAILPDKTVFWDASHSVALQLTMNDQGEFITGSAGDFYPYGIIIKNQSREWRQIVWPPENLRTDSHRDQCQITTCAGYLHGVAALDDKIFVTLGSLDGVSPLPMEGKVDPLLLVLDSDGQLQSQLWLAKGTAANEAYPSIVRYGNQLLVAWYDSESWGEALNEQVTVALLDSKGNLIGKPQTLDYRIDYSSPLQAFSNGEVGWIGHEYQTSTVKIVRIRR